MEFAELKGTVRAGTGKGPCRRLRATAGVPAIVYGGPGGPLPVTVAARDLAALLGAQRRGTLLIHFTLGGAGGDGGDRRTVVLKEVQRDPVRGSLLHADLLEVSMERRIRVEVPVELQGQPLGKAKGGLVEWILRDLTVECLPTAIPDALRVDVSALDIGHALHVRDLPVPEGVRVLEDPGRAVVAVTAPAAEEAAPAPAAPAPTEPEVLTKREGRAEAAAPAEEQKERREPDRKGKE